MFWDVHVWQALPRLRPTWTLHTFIVVGVYADFFLLGREGIIADVKRLQLVVTLQVWPAPHSAVDDVWEALTMRHLESSIERARDRDTFGGQSRIAETLLKIFKSTFLLLEFLHEWIDCFLSPFLLLITLLPPKKALHSRTREREQTVDARYWWRHSEYGKDELTDMFLDNYEAWFN